MRRAVEKLSTLRRIICWWTRSRWMAASAQRAIIHGDARSQSIAAASIVAKVERDACMTRWHEVFPQYGLDTNKGYHTPDHIKALEHVRSHIAAPVQL